MSVTNLYLVGFYFVYYFEYIVVNGFVPLINQIYKFRKIDRFLTIEINDYGDMPDLIEINQDSDDDNPLPDLLPINDENLSTDEESDNQLSDLLPINNEEIDQDTILVEPVE
jgi:hypothetical protein